MPKCGYLCIYNCLRFGELLESVDRSLFLVLEMLNILGLLSFWNSIYMFQLSISTCFLCSTFSILFSPFASVCVYFKFSSGAQLCPTLCDPMNCSTSSLPVHHQLPEFTQTHMHRVGNAIQQSHPLSSPSPPAPNPSQHQSLFQ